MRILLVEDHTLFRDALGLVLRQLDAQVKVINAGTAEEALAATAYYPDLDLILLDLGLPGTDGLSALAEMRRQAPTVPVVVVSASFSGAHVRAALAGGAAGYIPKTLSSQDTVAALRQILDGDLFVPASLLASLSQADGALPEQEPERVPETAAGATAKPDGQEVREPRGPGPLTARQLEVLRLIASGLSNKGIARRLELTEGTVKLHVSALMRGLGAHNRTEAVIAGQRLGLLDGGPD
ncbi:MAG: response regulator transcription factor [Thiohalocapsa sp.]|nr:response regulator transcription factor [Thiohalocapsa sp.]